MSEKTKKLILIVDDSPFDRSLLLGALRKKGFEVIEAGSGQQALEHLSQRKVDLILLDILMPDVSGIELLKQIRERYNAIELPVIMVTSKSDVADLVGALQLGANDYISKPVHFEVATSRIATHLQLAESSREMAELREMAALGAMVTTYNHEINNPLAIAFFALGRLEETYSGNADIEETRKALQRITDIVRRIREATQKSEVQFENYSGTSKMLKVK